MLSCKFYLVLVRVVPLTELTSSQQWWPISDKIHMRIGALEKNILRIFFTLRGYNQQLTLKGFFFFLPTVYPIPCKYPLPEVSIGNRSFHLVLSLFQFSLGKALLRRENVEPLLGALISPSLSSFQNPLGQDSMEGNVMLYILQESSKMIPSECVVYLKI